MWVNARGPEGLIDGKAGNACKLNDRQRQALVNIVKVGRCGDPRVVGWRLKDHGNVDLGGFSDLDQRETLSSELRSLGYRELSARPVTMPRTLRHWSFFKRMARPVCKRLMILT